VETIESVREPCCNSLIQRKLRPVRLIDIVRPGFDRQRNRFRSTEPSRRGSDLNGMTKSDETTELSWPWWAPWALLAVAVTSLLTVGATFYDIL
jgi:hypothetical protein